MEKRIIERGGEKGGGREREREGGSSVGRDEHKKRGGGRELPHVMGAKFLDFLTPSPVLSAFGSDLYYEIHATSLTTSAFP